MAQTFNYHSLPVEMESVSNVTATPSVDLGTIRTIGGAEYVYIYNAGTGAISVGQYATLSSNSGYSVAVSGVTGYEFPMGVCLHATIAAGSYGWLLGRGFGKVSILSNVSVTTSDILVPGAQGNFVPLGSLTSLQCAVAYQPLGYVVSGAASTGASTNTVCAAYVRLYGV